MELEETFFVIFLLFVLALYIHLKSEKKKQKEKSKDPFKAFKMRSFLKCEKCGKTFERFRKDFEYVLQEVGKCECGGKIIITKIFYEKKKTEKEKKWEKELEKWR